MQSEYKGYYLEEGESGVIYVYDSVDAWREKRYAYVCDDEYHAKSWIDLHAVKIQASSSKEYALSYDGSLIHQSLVNVVEPQLESGEIGPPEVSITIRHSKEVSGLTDEQVTRAFRKMIQWSMIEVTDFAFKVGYPADWEYMASRIREALAEVAKPPGEAVIEPKAPYFGPLPESLEWQWTEWGFYAYTAIDDIVKALPRMGILTWLSEKELHERLAHFGSREFVIQTIADLVKSGILMVRSRP